MFVNGNLAATHIGGYDAFSVDVSAVLKPTDNELVLAVYDPSEYGYQPHGKQKVEMISSPGWDTYTPSSGIWQPVWLERVPSAVYVSDLKVRGSTSALHLLVSTLPEGVPALVSGNVSLNGTVVATFSGGAAGVEMVIPVPSPQLWHMDSPTLYDLDLTIVEPSTGSADSVRSYFGMREVGLLNFSAPRVPPSGPRKGMTNSGIDMPGSPFKLAAADSTLCEAACNATVGCLVWSLEFPSCGGGGSGSAALCFLKESDKEWSADACRVSGDMGSPGGTALRPAINGRFTFLTGFLDRASLVGEQSLPARTHLAGQPARPPACARLRGRPLAPACAAARLRPPAWPLACLLAPARPPRPADWPALQLTSLQTAPLGAIRPFPCT